MSNAAGIPPLLGARVCAKSHAYCARGGSWIRRPKPGSPPTFSSSFPLGLYHDVPPTLGLSSPGRWSCLYLVSALWVAGRCAGWEAPGCRRAEAWAEQRLQAIFLALALLFLLLGSRGVWRCPSTRPLCSRRARRGAQSKATRGLGVAIDWMATASPPTVLPRVVSTTQRGCARGTGMSTSHPSLSLPTPTHAHTGNEAVFLSRGGFPHGLRGGLHAQHARPATRPW
jgi:hypothetical protein